MKPTIKIRTVAALRKAAANRRAVIGWSVAKPDVEKPAAWVLRMPFDRVTEALERGMAIYVPKVRNGDNGAASQYRLMRVGEVATTDDMVRGFGEWEQVKEFAGYTIREHDVGRFRRPIGKGSK